MMMREKPLIGQKGVKRTGTRETFRLGKRKKVSI